MHRRMTVAEYLSGEETNRPQELAYGVLREPPTPTFEHQIVVGALYRRLDQHVRKHKLGRVVISPVDVILDFERHLVVQPDLLFVSTERESICRDRIWGAPDLTVEVLSQGNQRHDRIDKAKWYRQYGVREYWLVDLIARHIEVRDLTSDAVPRVFEGRAIVRSRVLPGLRLRPADLFDERSSPHA
ncbi:MAG: Uma2 family endonuclease [Acidobacteria bacterium]|nr:Uma2 family endonuclease [Acidobacteriota bacterium]